MKLQNLFFLIIFLFLILNSQLKADWPFQTDFPNNLTSPTIADLDDDGDLEVVFSSWDGNLYCVTAAGDEVWRLHLGDDPDYDQLLRSSASLIDLNGDGTKEIVVGSGRGFVSGKLYVIAFDGTVLATYDVPAKIQGSPTVVDADLDGKFEIYFSVRTDPGTIYILEVNDNNGQIELDLVNTIQDPTGSSLTTPAVADLFGDDELEIIVGGGGSEEIFCYSNDGQTQYWSFRADRFINYFDPVIADLENDGEFEVLIGSTAADIYCLDAYDGDIKWQRDYGGNSLMHSPAVGDLDGDGFKEIVFGELGNVFHILNHLGQTIVAKTLSTDTQFEFSSPSIGDIDDDGEYEIVIGTRQIASQGKVARVYCLSSSTGDVIWDAQQTGTVYSQPALADLDDDGKLELVFGIYNGTFNALNSNGQQFQLQNPTGPPMNPFNSSPWMMMHRNLGNTSFFPIGVVQPPE